IVIPLFLITVLIALFYKQVILTIAINADIPVANTHKLNDYYYTYGSDTYYLVYHPEIGTSVRKTTADTTTFTILDGAVAKDNKNVYFNGKALPYLNAQSFSLVNSTSGKGSKTSLPVAYFKDDVSLYLVDDDLKRIASINGPSFRFIKYLDSANPLK